MYRQKHLLAVLILAIGLTAFFSCKKSSSTSLTGKPFYCKLDGTAFEPSGGGRYYNVPAGGIQIAGDNSATTLEIRLSAATVGTYTLGGKTASNFASVYYTSTGEYVSTAGEVKITKADGAKMSGTFKYSATGPKGTVEVTEGEFNDIPKK